MAYDHLRPLERVILRLRDDGMPVTEISRRVGKKPGTVHRIIRMTDFKDDSSGGSQQPDHPLRPVERVVRRLRSEGETYGEIGNRLGRSGAQVRRIEEYSRLKVDD